LATAVGAKVTAVVKHHVGGLQWGFGGFTGHHGQYTVNVGGVFGVKVSGSLVAGVSHEDT
jgi:hypothetical protein